ncbi:MAG: glycosyltransferase [Candidatus Eisenbacteria bacterium]|nr:glycosyltransferase [Candidatus Eisenbacteria bacterium]
MDGDLTVSVVIPTHGRRGLLERTLASLAVQTHPPERMEVVVADDASPDDTRAFLSTLETPWRLITAVHETNRGRSAARNTALERATGDVVLFVDDDMRCEPGLVERHVACHKAHPDTAFVGTALSDPELGRSTVASFYDGMGVNRLSPGSRIPARYFVTNNASVPRRPLEAVGGFDAAFSCYGFEDCELGFRLEEEGLDFRHCPDAVAYHMEPMTLDGFLEKRREAPLAIAALLEKHPHRAVDLPFAALMPPASGDHAWLSVRKAAVRLLTARPLCSVVKGLASSFWWGRLSVPIVTYLVACEYRRGLATATAARRRWAAL